MLYTLRPLFLMTAVASPLGFGICLGQNVAAPKLQVDPSKATGKDVRDTPVDPPRPISSISGSSYVTINENNVSPFMLLASPAVEKELKFSSLQLAQLKELYANYVRDIEKSRKAGTAKPGVSDVGVSDVREEIDGQYRARLAKILSKKESQRLVELRLQVLGASAMADPEIAALLNIGPAQQELFVDLREEGLERDRALRQASASMSDDVGAALGPSNYEEIAAFKAGPGYLAKLARIRSQIDENARHTKRQMFIQLTRKQKKKFKSLLGEPFDVAVFSIDDTPPRLPPGPSSLGRARPSGR